MRFQDVYKGKIGYVKWTNLYSSECTESSQPYVITSGHYLISAPQTYCNMYQRKLWIFCFTGQIVMLHMSCCQVFFFVNGKSVGIYYKGLAEL